MCALISDVREIIMFIVVVLNAGELLIAVYCMDSLSSWHNRQLLNECPKTPRSPVQLPK